VVLPGREETRTPDAPCDRADRAGGRSGSCLNFETGEELVVVSGLQVVELVVKVTGDALESMYYRSAFIHESNQRIGPHRPT
jgi:hypothetical protein